MSTSKHAPRFSKAFARMLTIGLLAGLVMTGCQRAEIAVRHVNEDEEQREAIHQAMLYLEDLHQQLNRIHRVYYDIAQAAVPFCPQDRVLLDNGIKFFSKDNLKILGTSLVRSAEIHYNYGTIATVYYVHPNTTAALKGVRPGDKIVPVPNSPDNFTFQAIRDGNTLGTFSGGVPTCAFQAFLERSSEVNAYADGNKIIITSGILRIMDDNLLADAMAHEMSHNIMKHTEKKTVNSQMGEFVGFLADILLASQGINTQGGFSGHGQRIGANAYSQEFEKEADLLGIHIMTLAGYDAMKAVETHRKLAIENPNSIWLSSTHPTSANRSAVKATVGKELMEKVANRQPLRPEIPRFAQIPDDRLIRNPAVRPTTEAMAPVMMANYRKGNPEGPASGPAATVLAQQEKTKTPPVTTAMTGSPTQKSGRSTESAAVSSQARRAESKSTRSSLAETKSAQSGNDSAIAKASPALPDPAAPTFASGETPEKKSMGKGYSVYMGSFSDTATLEQIQTRLTQNQIKATRQEITIKDQTFQRLYAGSYPSRRDAEAVQSMLQDKLGMKSEVVPTP
ncbi:MAG: M48 family metalloprotease [Magnetococcus sp. DMHC-1]|nr:M48 family metalloprotease [Magnetococcales bacterium]